MERLQAIYHPDCPDFLSRMARAPAMRRLARVGMNCGCEYTAFPRFQRGRAYTRCLHSLGVGRIVWHFTRDPAQAVAGLLHDIATPVFAHVVDFLRGDYLTQESTEEGTEALIRGSKALCAVLEELGLRVEQVSDYHVYPIADNDSPRLSADRLEYTLGNSLNYGLLPAETIRALYQDLTVTQNEAGVPELAFLHPDKALCFARTALACSEIYVSPADRYSMQRLAELLGESLGLGILTQEDLYTDEPLVIAKLKASSLAPAWAAFCRLHQAQTGPAPLDGRWRQIPAKKRCIDPLVAGQGRVSALDPAFGEALAAFLAAPQSEWILCE